MDRNMAAMGVAAITIMVSGAAILYFLQSPGSGGETQESIRLGNMLYEYSGLVFIADEQGFFSENGLEVTFQNYTSTVASIEELEQGKTDMTVVPEYSIVAEAFEREDILVIGTIDKYQSVFLVARKDRGIKNVSDLKGKTIGASKGTIGEFYLGRFLDLEGMRMEDVALADLSAIQYVDALTNGSVDAVVVVYKYLDQSRERLGTNLVTWPIQSSQRGYVVVVCTGDWAAGHPGTINRVLRSIRQAEDYAVTHPERAKAIIQERMNYTDATMSAIWPDHQFSLTLDQSLITAMEDEARWMIANNLTNATEVPDFRKYISPEGLETVKPDSVNLIG